MMLSEIERRDPGIVLVLSVFTCGFYLLFWYYKIYDELETLAGDTPTGRSYGFDLFLTIITCSLYGIWVDYRISLTLQQAAHDRGMTRMQDTSTVAIVLDLASMITGMLTNFISSAIHQDQLNKLVRHIRDSGDPYRSPDVGDPTF